MKYGVVRATHATRRFCQCVEYLLQIERRATNDLQNVCRCGLPLKRLFQLAGENVYLLLKVSNGWNCTRCISLLKWVRFHLTQIPGFVPWQEVRFGSKAV